MAKRVKIPGRLESAETGNIVTGADAVMDDEKGKTQVVINSEVDAAIINLAQGKQDNLTFDNAPTEDSPNPVTSAGVYTADKVLSDAIEAILLLIPSAASALNKLVDMQTMNSSIATATASFKGTYNLVSDLHLGVDATHEQIGAALDALSLGADNNDYAFVQVPNSATAPTEISKTERYKFNGANWLFEYDLNNSGFTQGQWNAINSGVTSLLVGKLSDLPTNAELTTLLAGKQDNLTFDNVPTAGSPNPVKSGGVYARNNEIVALINALDAAKQDVLTFDNAPVEGSPNPVKSGGVYTAISAVQAAIVALDTAKQNVLTFDSTPTLGSPNPVTSSGIKTELNRIDGNITTLNDLYEALTQSALMVVQPTDIWPVVSPATSTIYRVVDRVNTPPQNYSDYMWNGSAMVLMATYDNAIDPEPTAGSDNLVKSGGVYEGLYGKTYTEKDLSNTGFVRYSSGILENGGYKTSDFIPVNKGDVFHITDFCSNTVALISAYSSNNEASYLKSQSVWGDTKGSAGSIIKYIVPNGVNYIRFSCSSDAASLFKSILENNSIEIKVNAACEDIDRLEFDVYGQREYGKNDLINPGVVRYTTGIKDKGSYWASEYIPVKPNYKITGTISGSSTVAVIAAYSSDVESSYIRTASIAGDGTTQMTLNYTVPDGVNYIRICCDPSGLENFAAIIDKGLSDERVFTSVNFTQPSYLLKKNRVSVNFTFDDGVEQDSQIKSVFDEFGFKCGFGIIGSNERYIQYAKEGFEILAHNSGILYDKTETEIRASMVQGKNYVESLGLICHGWVTPSSALPSNLTYVTNDYFEYGFTVYKGESTTGQTMTKNMKSYNLWRIHMNTLLPIYQNIFADAMQNDGMISVYAHGYQLDQEGNWTLNDLREILQYCKDNLIEVLTPYQSCLKLFGEKHNES